MHACARFVHTSARVRRRSGTRCRSQSAYSRCRWSALLRSPFCTTITTATDEQEDEEEEVDVAAEEDAEEAEATEAEADDDDGAFLHSDDADADDAADDVEEEEAEEEGARPTEERRYASTAALNASTIPDLTCMRACVQACRARGVQSACVQSERASVEANQIGGANRKGCLNGCVPVTAASALPLLYKTPRRASIRLRASERCLPTPLRPVRFPPYLRTSFGGRSSALYP